MTKLVPVPVELSKLSGVAKNNVVKKTVYDKLVEKVNNIDTNGLVLKTKYDTDKSELEKKFLNYQACEKKLTDHNLDKYITTSEFNKLTAEKSAARLKYRNLVTKTDFDDKLKSLNQKNNSNETKHLLVENELKSYKHLTQVILEVKIILKMMVHKTVQYFNQYTDILQEL